MNVYRMDAEDVDRFFKLKEVKYSVDGNIVGHGPSPGNLLNSHIGFDLATRHRFCTSNYVLVAPNVDSAASFNFALKLAGLSSSALFIGFQITEPLVASMDSAKAFLFPPAYYGINALKIGDAEIQELRFGWLD